MERVKALLEEMLAESPDLPTFIVNDVQVVSELAQNMPGIIGFTVGGIPMSLTVSFTQ